MPNLDDAVRACRDPRTGAAFRCLCRAGVTGSGGRWVHLDRVEKYETSAGVRQRPHVSGEPVPAASSRFGGDDPQPVPCGTVVPSEVYTEPGAMSVRSSDTCGGTWSWPSLATAGGGFTLDTLTQQIAPRGLRSTSLSMRGKPTMTGQSDTARLLSGGHSYFSPAVPGETITTTQPTSYPWEPAYGTYTRSLRWSIETLGTDSYDVADLTVHYTYLTPQP